MTLSDFRNLSFTIIYTTNASVYVLLSNMEFKVASILGCLSVQGFTATKTLIKICMKLYVFFPYCIIELFVNNCPTKAYNFLPE